MAAYGYVEFGLKRTLTVGAERVTIARVSYDTFREYIPVTGNVVPRTTVYLDAVEGGQITAVHVEEGAFVTAGQPLVTFKNTNLELQVIGAEAQLTEQLNFLSTTRQNFEQSRLRNQRELIDIEYQIDRLSRDLARRQPLLATGGVTKGQLDDLEAELARYRNLLRSRRAATALGRGIRHQSAHAHERSARGAEPEARDRARQSEQPRDHGADRGPAHAARGEPG